MQLYRFKPILKSTIWGGSRIANQKRLAGTTNIGESWEISGLVNQETKVCDGEEHGVLLSDLIAKYKEKLLGETIFQQYGEKFPFLIKFIDARDNLSVQVHPNGVYGKSEVWYILDTIAGAQIYAGQCVKLDLNDDEVFDNIIDKLNVYDSRPGDVFYIPAGTLHSIGAGNFLIEIQQASDITYRVYDYNRCDAKGAKRPLHLSEARTAINNMPIHCKVNAKIRKRPIHILLENDIFRIAEILLEDNNVHLNGFDTFCVLACVDGEVTFFNETENTTESLIVGDVCLLPCQVPLHLAGNGHILCVTP